MPTNHNTGQNQLKNDERERIVRGLSDELIDIKDKQEYVEWLENKLFLSIQAIMFLGVIICELLLK